MDCNGVSWIRGAIIGKGSFGKVFLAKPKSRHTHLPSTIAVKSAEYSASASLQKETEILNNLNGCPYIIRCFGEEPTIAENGEMAYNMLLEHASEGTLDAIIKKSIGSGLPEDLVKRYTKCILEGLSHIHGSDYVHCDLKPDNILMVPSTKSSKLVAKVGDLGLAKRVQRRKIQRREFDPYVRGTSMYMAPETVLDSIQEPPSDIWALGCVVLEMLTGKKAWDVKPNITTEQVLDMIGDGYSLPKIPTWISKEARAFLKGCFVRNTQFRFTAQMLLDHDFLEGLDDEFKELEQEFRELEEPNSSDSVQQQPALALKRKRSSCDVGVSDRIKRKKGNCVVANLYKALKKASSTPAKQHLPVIPAPSSSPAKLLIC